MREAISIQIIKPLKIKMTKYQILLLFSTQRTVKNHFSVPGNSTQSTRNICVQWKTGATVTDK
jgi:hypothetical protein